jgi:hypothetical protein
MGFLSTIGRPSNKVEYVDVVYNNQKYTVGIVMYKTTKLYFVIDFEDSGLVSNYSWHKCSDYISSSHYHENNKKEIFLHNIVMNKLTFNGRGQTETVDHINRNPLDNRKCNLRIATQTQQLVNQRKKSRSVTLPSKYNLNPNDLPKHVTYVPVRGNHGDGFCVEFKLNGKKIYNPYIRSKVLTIEEKLDKIKALLQKGYELYPEFNPDREKELRDNLEREYQQIITSI